MALMLRHDSSAGCGVRLDQVEVDAVAPEVGPAGEHDHARGPRLGAAQRGGRAPGTAPCPWRRCGRRSAASRPRPSPRSGSRARSGVSTTASGASGDSGTPARRSPSTIVAGSLKAGSPPSARRRCVIHTAPSRVARRMAPSRCATTVPGVAACGRAPPSQVRAVQIHRQAQHFVEHARACRRRHAPCAARWRCRRVPSRWRGRPGASAAGRGPPRSGQRRPAAAAARPPPGAAASAAAPARRPR